MNAAADHWFEQHGEWVAAAFALLLFAISANWL